MSNECTNICKAPRVYFCCIVFSARHPVRHCVCWGQVGKMCLLVFIPRCSLTKIIKYENKPFNICVINAHYTVCNLKKTNKQTNGSVPLKGQI